MRRNDGDAAADQAMKHSLNGDQPCALSIQTRSTADAGSATRGPWHDPKKWKLVFQRNKRGAFARRSSSDREITPKSDAIRLNQVSVAAFHSGFGPLLAKTEHPEQ